LRSAIRARCRARHNRAISGKHPARWPVRVCRVAGRTVTQTKRPVAECPAFARAAEALRSERY
jgi:hypothetical protein